MAFTRREFIKGGVAAFTWGFAAPSFLSDLARAQSASARNLVILYLSGGNDTLSTLVPYGDAFYYSRRPALGIPAANVLQVGTDSGGAVLGLNPRLTGLKTIYDQGRLALIQRCGYQNSSRSHFFGVDIWSTATPTNSTGPGWLGRYLDLLPDPVDALYGWNTTGSTPRTLLARTVSVPAIPNPATYALSSPNGGADGQAGRTALSNISSHLNDSRAHLSFVNGTTQSALNTLDRVATVATYAPSLTYPNNGFGRALQTVAGALVKQVGTRIFFVQTGGFDTHSHQDTNLANGSYVGLMGTLNDGLIAFHNDLQNQGLINNTLVLMFTEFGRRISENGSAGTDHGAATLMFAMGGAVRGGLYGTAGSLQPFTGNPALENSGGDLTYETDFRSVYAKVIDNWLGTDSAQILGGNFTNGPAIV
jgi:uncharacterized protein (DUF1501 family)